MKTISLAVAVLLLPRGSAVALDRDPTVVGRWWAGGGIHLEPEIEGADGHVYCTASSDTWTGLAVFDIGDPLRPRLVTLYESPIGARGDGSGLIVSEDLAYMNTDAGLLVLDVRDPYLPRQLSATTIEGEAASDFCLARDVVYLANGGLTVIDVSDPEQPAVAGSWQLEGANAKEVVVSGTHAYVGDAEKGLRVLDVSDPAGIRQLVHYDNGGLLNGIQNVVFFNDHVYFRTGQWSDFRSIGLDVSEPANPRAVYVGAETVPPFMADGFAYSAQAVVDLSDPTLPRSTARWGNGSQDIFVSGTLGYVPDPGIGLCVLDLSDPATPEHVGRHIRWFNGIVDTKDGVNMLRLVGDRLYMISSGHSGLGVNLQLFDVADPASPHRLDAKHLEVGSPRDLCVTGDHLYVTYYASPLGDPRRPGMLVLDIHNPESIDVVGVIEGTTFFSGGDPERVDLYDNVVVFGNYAYVEGGPGDLLMLDVSRPDAPRIETGLIGHGAPFVLGDRVYAQNPDGKLVDVTDPLNPGSPFVFDLGFDLGPPFSRGQRFVVSGEYAYVNQSGDRLSIFDISDVTSPELASELELGVFTPRGLKVVGDYAYVGFGVIDVDDFIDVIDVGDRRNPRPRWQRRAGGAAFWENLAYVPNASGFQVIDLSVSPTPAPRVGLCEASLTGPELHGTTAFLSGSFLYRVGAGEMYVFDVSRPERPGPLAHYESVIVERYLRRVLRPRVAFEFAVSGNHAFIAWRVNVGRDVRVLETIDVSDPAEPKYAGLYENLVGSFRSGLAVSGNHAYLGTSEGFEIVDVSDPVHPSRAGEYAGAVRSTEFARGDHVFVSTPAGFDVIDASDASAPRVVCSHAGDLGARLGDLVYVNRGGGVTELLDFTNPASPVVAGSVDGPVPTTAWGELGLVGERGDLGIHRTHILDLSDPLAPRTIGKLSDRSLIAAGDVVIDVSRDLEVIDISRPANPQRLGSLGNLRADSRGDLAVSGALALVAHGRHGLLVYDVSDATRPTRIGAHDTGGAARGISVSESRAFVPDENTGLVVVDVSNPAEPRRVQAIAFDGLFAVGVTVSGERAYVGLGSPAGETRLAVFDVSNPDEPHRRGTVDLGQGRAEGIAVAGGFAYVNTLWGGLDVVDVRNPDLPRRVGGHERAGDMEISGDLLYVASGDLIVFDISSPTEPRPLFEPPEFRPDGPRFRRVAIAGDIAYAIDERLGLEVLDLTDPASPRRVSGNSVMTESTSIAVADGRVYTLDESGLTVLGLEFPFPPRDVSTAAGDREIELSWIEPSGGLEIVGYNVVHVAGDGSETLLNETPVTDLSFTATGLENGAEACFVVESVGAGGATSEAPLVCATPKPPPVVFRRGDCNEDGAVNLADAVCTLDWLFRGRRDTRCLSALDTNRDGAVNITDPIALLGFLFLGGPGPLNPFSDCGAGITPGDAALGCGASQRSCQ